MTGNTHDVRGKILVVDDYPANVKLIRRNLEAEGYETVAAYDGEEALEKVAAEKPDLILLDILMPKLDGFEVCRRIRADEATAVVPIIMVTALRETEDRIQGLEAGADDFLSKPFDRGELLARVKSLLQIKYYRSMLTEREKFHAVIQDLSHGIIITDGRWCVETISRRAAELVGRPDENLVGRGLDELLAPFDVEPSLDALRQSMVRSVTVELTREETRPPTYLAGRYTRIEGPRGELHNAALVFRDISEMRQKEKLKRDFLSLISHKLKTPLTIVGGYLALIAEGSYGEVPPAMAEKVRISLAKVRELSDLIEKVLSYAGLTARELERAGQLVPLGELVERTRRRIEQRYAHRAVNWVIDLPGDLPRARAPEELLSIVVDNLLDNAVKFAEEPEIRIEVGGREIEDREIEVAIRDNGPGIRAQQREQVFSAFAQLDDAFTGNVAGIGLGLSTARRLVNSWGGRIDCDSVPGGGSRFFFTVPSEFTPPRERPDASR
ncbi:MAG TPA: response regulator [Phycisphaerae bacterium]|nr:response regulator [Phycisphaerae bacterium]